MLLMTCDGIGVNISMSSASTEEVDQRKAGTARPTCSWIQFHIVLVDDLLALTYWPQSAVTYFDRKSRSRTRFCDRRRDETSADCDIERHRVIKLSPKKALNLSVPKPESGRERKKPYVKYWISLWLNSSSLVGLSCPWYFCSGVFFCLWVWDVGIVSQRDKEGSLLLDLPRYQIDCFKQGPVHFEKSKVTSQ